MSYREAIAALIPVHNDAYVLPFCLEAALAPSAGIDQVLIFDDASTDGSAAVIQSFMRLDGRVRVTTSPRQVGWIEAPNFMLTQCDARHVLMIDADDVLTDNFGPLFRERVLAGPRPHVRLRLCELWGDLRHTTQRWWHTDPTHVYVDRAHVSYMKWIGPVWGRVDTGSVPTGNTDFLAAFHVKGVKPDERLVARKSIRRWLRSVPVDRTSCEQMIDLPSMPPEQVHREAVEFLLGSRIDRPQVAYAETGEPLGGAPPLPTALRRALPGRFRFVYDGAGRIIDRTDTERD